MFKDLYINNVLFLNFSIKRAFRGQMGAPTTTADPNRRGGLLTTIDLEAIASQGSQ